MRIKKGYIILAVLLLGGLYFYISYQNKKQKEHITQLAQELVSNIRYQDYFFFHKSLPKEQQDKISIEDIKKFIQRYHFSRDAKFILKNYESSDNTLNIAGFIQDKNKTYPTIITLREQNNTLIINNLEINSSKLEPKEFSFPIVLEKKESNSSIAAN